MRATYERVYSGPSAEDTKTSSRMRSWSGATLRSAGINLRKPNYRKNDQFDPPVGFEVQVWVPSLLVVQVVLDDGGVLLETSIHPQQANAPTIMSARKKLLRLVRIVHTF